MSAWSVVVRWKLGRVARAGRSERGECADPLAASKVGDGGRGIVTEQKHRDALAALISVVGINAHECAAMNEFGDVLVGGTAGDDHEIDSMRGVGKAGELGFAALHRTTQVRCEFCRAGEAGGRPEIRL